MVMDFDLWLRAVKMSAPQMIDDYLAVFVMHQFQKTNSKNLIIQTKELVEILRKEKVSLIYILKLILTKSNNLLHSLVKSIFIKLNIIDKNYQSIPFSLRKQ